MGTTDPTALILQKLQKMNERDQQLKESYQKRMQDYCHGMRRMELVFHAELFASVGTLEESKPKEYEPVGSDPEESDLEESEYDPESEQEESEKKCPNTS